MSNCIIDTKLWIICEESHYSVTESDEVFSWQLNRGPLCSLCSTIVKISTVIHIDVTIYDKIISHICYFQADTIV